MRSRSYSILPTSGPPSPTALYASLLYSHHRRSFRSNLIVGLGCLALACFSVLGSVLVFGSPAVAAPLLWSWCKDGQPRNAAVLSDFDRMKKLEIMVEQTEGYYARDWSLWLGWNNLRYMLETGLMHSKILNRTLIIPSYVYMRACEYPHSACAAFAKQVNRGDAVGTDEWRSLPEEQQQAWMMPIGHMVDLVRLREAGWSVVTGEEFGLLEGIPVQMWEAGNGTFPFELPEPNLRARSNPNATHIPLDVYHISNYAYEPNNTLRIDRSFAPRPAQPAGSELIIQQVLDSLAPLLEELHNGAPIAWLEASAYLRRDLGWGLKDEAIENALRWAGFERLWSFGTPDDMTKDVSKPNSYLVDAAHTVAFAEDFGRRRERIIHLQGEIHLGRPPASILFSTPDAANQFASMVLRELRPVREVELLGERLAERMSEKVQGRMWVAAHLRRGDFVRYSWAPSQSIEKHLARVQYHLDAGKELLRTVKAKGTAQAPRVGDFSLDRELWGREPPRFDDPFYIATDDHDPHSISAIHDNRGVLLADLLTPQDRQELVGWPLLFTDVLSEVEQEVLARSAYFNGNRMSSVAGGVLNMRVALGRDPRTGSVN